MNVVPISIVPTTRSTLESGETGFSGFIHGVALVDLLQIFHYSRRSLTLHIEPNAAIYLADGEIVHARAGELEGQVAFTSLLQRNGGRIRTAAAEVVPTSMTRPFNFLLLDALRGMDEADRDGTTEVWPEESGEFLKETRQVSRGSIFPSVPAAGNQLLATACMQLAERVENTCAVALVDLDQRLLLAQCGSISRGLLEKQCLMSFERPQLQGLEQALAKSGALPANAGAGILDEVRYVGASGAFFGKLLTGRRLALVLCARCDDSPGLAWAELRHSVRMMERILP
ncbi:MAG TPA: DUF4388 domain-containing protein [Polyangiaceae bacterium]|nr:DUF4388 domain-containing protein [Polyangiaceae bacterium]